MSRTLALFDFDGTITNKDSLFDFLAFGVSKPIFILKLCQCAPFLIAFKFGLISNSKAKQRLFSAFCKGRKRALLETQAQLYSKTQLPKILRAQALKKMRWHITQRHKVVVVSASLDLWLQPFCEDMGIGLIATKMHTLNGVASGKFDSKNCNGLEKIARIRQELDLSHYQEIIAYGDSKGDTEMLALATSSHYKPFR